MNWKKLKSSCYFQAHKGRSFAKKWLRNNKTRKQPEGKASKDLTPFVTPPNLSKGQNNVQPECAKGIAPELNG